ncbi:hypothetical protein QJS10_CPB13g00992 [Acorus calamus]|uniref:Uncharacterized protein n=1 Tax=Acorus calamus TaxID=4465 RepID=A0AAV9DHC0_ACOCL|nr:hypothetical protein QJS10_CPB13g00992 [Acorus calamus]
MVNYGIKPDTAFIRRRFAAVSRPCAPYIKQQLIETLAGKEDHDFRDFTKHCCRYLFGRKKPFSSSEETLTPQRPHSVSTPPPPIGPPATPRCRLHRPPGHPASDLRPPPPAATPGYDAPCDPPPPSTTTTCCGQHPLPCDALKIVGSERLLRLMRQIKENDQMTILQPYYRVFDISWKDKRGGFQVPQVELEEGPQGCRMFGRRRCRKGWGFSI